jgi:hypothetical protein
MMYSKSTNTEIAKAASSIARALAFKDWTKKTICRIAQARNIDLRDLYITYRLAFILISLFIRRCEEIFPYFRLLENWPPPCLLSLPSTITTTTITTTTISPSLNIPWVVYSVFRIVFPYLRIRPTLPIPYVLSHTGSVDRITFLIRPVYRIEILIYTVRARILLYGSGDLGGQGRGLEPGFSMK